MPTDTPLWPEGRREAVCAWLTANDIDPNDIPIDSDLAISYGTGGPLIHYEAFDRETNGAVFVNWSGEGPAVSKRTAPMKVPPPVWWEPRAKPTRDQLLGVVTRVHAELDALSAEIESFAAQHNPECECEWIPATRAAVERIRKALEKST